MFAKRQHAFAGVQAAAPRLPRIEARRVLALAAKLRDPYLGAPVAAVFLLTAAALFYFASADPRAGLPTVRAPVSRGDAAPGQPPPTGIEAFTIDTLGMFQDLAVPGFELQDAPPVQGTAVIVLPDGAADGVPQSSTVAARRAPADPLPPAPIAGVVQPGPLGPLPAIAPDGRTPFSAYARPFRSDGSPKVALVVGGLGLNAAATRAAIERLPAEVTLSFVPYADGLQGWIDLARADGHEVLLEIPMEPANYPDNDPGPYTLLSNSSPEEVVRRLEWLMSRASGYYGVTNYLGERFVGSDQPMNSFLVALKSRGLAFIDDGSARRSRGAWARASADRIVDDQLSADAIVAQLNALETAARTRGQALGSGFAYPVTVEVAARWAEGLKARGVQLAPASAIAKR